jgi:hypothetical protein
MRKTTEEEEEEESILLFTPLDFKCMIRSIASRFLLIRCGGVDERIDLPF